MTKGTIHGVGYTARDASFDYEYGSISGVQEAVEIELEGVEDENAYLEWLLEQVRPGGPIEPAAFIEWAQERFSVALDMALRDAAAVEVRDK